MLVNRKGLTASLKITFLDNDTKEFGDRVSILQNEISFIDFFHTVHRTLPLPKLIMKTEFYISVTKPLGSKFVAHLSLVQEVHLAKACVVGWWRKLPFQEIYVYRTSDLWKVTNQFIKDNIHKS